MIYFFYGENRIKLHEALNRFLDEFFAKSPDSTLIEMTVESWSGERLEELLASRALFGGTTAVILSNLFDDEIARETILERLKDMKNSTNTFIVIEGKLPKAISEKIAKNAESAEEFPAKVTAKKEEFNRFALTDALGRKSKKDLWVLLTKALLEEIPAEEIHGILFWQVKSMLLARAAKSASEAGLNPFVYKKALGFSRNFTEAELKSISSKLVAIYHESRRGGDELPIALEKFALNI